MKRIIYSIQMLVVFIGLSYSMGDCVQSIEKCTSIRKQERLCKKKPLGAYQKNLHTAEEFMHSAIKEYEFFKTIELDGNSNSCSFYGNLFTFQLIESLLMECIKHDSSYIFKANILLSKSYLSIGKRGRIAIESKKFIFDNKRYAHVSTHRISYLKGLSQYFSKGISVLDALPINPDEKDEYTKMIVDLHIESAKLHAAIAKELTASPFPENIDKDKCEDYSRALKSKIYSEYCDAISILEKLFLHEIEKEDIQMIDSLKTTYMNLSNDLGSHHE